VKGLRLRVAVVALAASATALLALLALVAPGLRARARDGVQQTLLAEARLMAHVVEQPLARGEGPGTIDPLVDGAAGEVGARVTVIRPDGRVVADSARSGAELVAMENHGQRPEVLAALAAGNGSSLRHSATVHEDMLYTAVPVRSGGRLVGVVRVARPLSDLAAQVAELRRGLLIGLALAFAITAVASTLLSSSLVGPLRDLMAAARRIGRGELGLRVPARRNDEIGELARILDGAREQLQQRFAESARDRARLSAILSGVADGVLAIDHDGAVVAVSDSLASVLPGEVLGRSYLEAFRQRQVVDVADAVLAGRSRHASAEVELRPAGRVYSISAVPFPGPEGQPPGAVLTFEDVTARQRLEAVRREFVANASHELRTPLTSIRGFVEALEDGALRDADKGPRFLEKIRRHADRMGALLDDLLELSRLESGERPTERVPVSLTALAEDVLAGFRDAAAAKGVTLTGPTASAPEVLSDPERLQRILVNLVDNAVKYTPAGGHVAVSCAPTSAGRVVVEVSDDGPGIPAEHQARIFERFYRVDKARSREAGGTGLGLSIVRHAAESIGARVSLESAAGRGARFAVELPAPSPSPSSGSEPRGRRST
jgi:two-component system phosphate regulon sensor histidine kinase PhoR